MYSETNKISSLFNWCDCRSYKLHKTSGSHQIVFSRESVGRVQRNLRRVMSRIITLRNAFLSKWRLWKDRNTAINHLRSYPAWPMFRKQLSIYEWHVERELLQHGGNGLRAGYSLAK